MAGNVAKRKLGVLGKPVPQLLFLFALKAFFCQHANRNQLKQSSAALLEEVKRYVAEGGKKGESAKALLTRVQTVVGDCWSFYTNSNDPWKVLCLFTELLCSSFHAWFDSTITSCLLKSKS